MHALHAVMQWQTDPYPGPCTNYGATTSLAAWIAMGVRLLLRQHGQLPAAFDKCPGETFAVHIAFGSYQRREARRGGRRGRRRGESSGALAWRMRSVTTNWGAGDGEQIGAEGHR